MNISQQVIILSAERTENTFEGNRQRSESLKGLLGDLNLPFKEAEGYYKGNTETSLVVIVSNQAEIDTVKNFAFETFDQDTVLYQDANQEAYLITKDGATERLGRLLPVTEKEAIEKGNYTKLGGQFFTTIKR